MADLAAVASLTELAERIRPTAPAAERILPVVDELITIFPWGGLSRGSTVAVRGSTSFALATIAAASASGSWLAVVGTDSIGWSTASDLGVDLSRVLVVPRVPVGDWAAVVAALVDAVDVTLVSPTHAVSARDARRLAARARERGAVLLVSESRFAWPTEPDVSIQVSGEWSGIGRGHGRLRARRVTVATSGRRGAARPRHLQLWLPTAEGGLGSVEGGLGSVEGDMSPPLRLVGS